MGEMTTIQRSPAQGGGRVVRSALVGFWQYAAIPLPLRILSLTLAVLLFIPEAIIRVSGQFAMPIGNSLVMPSGVVGFAMPVLTLLIFAVLLWRPPLGTVLLLAVGVVGLAIGQGGRYLTSLACLTGFVLFACGLRMVGVFVAAGLCWIVIVTLVPPGLGDWGTVMHLLVALVSGAIGWSMRLLSQRHRMVHRELAVQEERLQAELRAERERIADELHDVIAHEISIIAMQARVLERTDDPDERARAQSAISRGAAQALADTRRVLHLIHRTPEAVDPAPPDLSGTIASLAEKLRLLGSTVEVTEMQLPPLARSIETTLVRMANESVTNIVKHSSAPRAVIITLTAANGMITVVFASRGGPVPAKAKGASSGFGLARLQERAIRLGGTFSARQIGEYWTARMTLPQR